MNREQKTVMVLVAAVAALGTLVAVELVGREPAYAQSGPGQAGFLSVVVGPQSRNNTLPIIVVDSQQMAIMTYDLSLVGAAPDLRLTNARSMRYDRRMNEYYVGMHRRPHEPPSRNNANTVEEMRVASQRQRPLE